MGGGYCGKNFYSGSVSSFSRWMFADDVHMSLIFRTTFVVLKVEILCSGSQWHAPKSPAAAPKMARGSMQRHAVTTGACMLGSEGCWG